MINPCAKASLNSRQNSVRCWSIWFLIICLSANFYYYNSVSFFVAGAQGGAGTLAAIALLALGPKSQEHSTSRLYKMSAAIVLIVLALVTVGLFFTVQTLQQTQQLAALMLSTCCAAAPCAPAQLPCAFIASQFGLAIPILIGSCVHMGVMLIFDLVLIFKIGMAVKHAGEPAKTQPTKAEV